MILYSVKLQVLFSLFINSIIEKLQNIHSATKLPVDGGGRPPFRPQRRWTCPGAPRTAFDRWVFGGVLGFRFRVPLKRSIRVPRKGSIGV